MTRHLLRISFVLLLLFGGLQSIKAQINAQITEYRNNLAVGFNGGVTFNNITFSPNVKQSFHQGIVGGFTARYISEKYFSMICGLQVECKYPNAFLFTLMAPSEQSSCTTSPTKTETGPATNSQTSFMIKSLHIKCPKSQVAGLLCQQHASQCLSGFLCLRELSPFS